ncbi:MAG: hypothetical protein IJ760_07040 [Bacteroidales bacterium]|nr:hypothetical protein [Bacteroidales bacterium]
MAQRVDFGAMIGEELRRRGLPVAWFAEQMACDRSNMYRLLRRADLDSGFITRASLLLGKDFYAEASKQLAAERPTVADTVVNVATNGAGQCV